MTHRWTAQDRNRSVLATLREIWSDLVANDHLLYQLTVRDIRVKYKQAVMGFAWAVFMPVLIVLSGVIVRFAMAYLSGQEFDSQVIAGLAIKSIPWAFAIGAIQFSSGVLIGNRNLITKIYFPREVLPLSAVLAQGFDSLIGGVAVLILFPIFSIGVGVQSVWAIPLLLSLFLMTVAAALLLSCANLFFRDVKYIVGVVLTFGIFFTPVFFEPEMFGPIGARVMMVNPLAPILEGLRLSVIEGHNLFHPLTVMVGGETVLAWSPWYLLYVLVFSVVGTGVAALVFHRLEFLFAEYI